MADVYFGLWALLDLLFTLYALLISALSVAFSQRSIRTIGPKGRHHLGWLRLVSRASSTPAGTERGNVSSPDSQSLSPIFCIRNGIAEAAPSRRERLPHLP